MILTYMSVFFLEMENKAKYLSKSKGYFTKCLRTGSECSRHWNWTGRWIWGIFFTSLSLLIG